MKHSTIAYYFISIKGDVRTDYLFAELEFEAYVAGIPSGGSMKCYCFKLKSAVIRTPAK